MAGDHRRGGLGRGERRGAQTGVKYAGATRRVLVVLLAVFAGSAASARADGARIVAEHPLPDRGVDLTIATNAFTAPTEVQVFLPAGYDADPSRRWPVTYYLHRAQGDA